MRLEVGRASYFFVPYLNPTILLRFVPRGIDRVHRFVSYAAVSFAICCSQAFRRFLGTRRVPFGR
jgi:hypothetical protein